MPDDPREFVFARAELLARGISDRRVAKAIAAGRLVRVRRGWFAVPTAPEALMAAVRAGGRLSCVSALKWHGVWTMPHELHLSIPRGSKRAPTRHRVHWRDASAVSSATLVERPLDAFTQFARCGPNTDVIVAADSALNRRILSIGEVGLVLERTRRGRRILTRVDPAAESGTETLVRLGLRRLRIAARSQVEISSVGRVDFVVGNRLVIEVDGQTWHDTEPAFESDRRRDAALVARGYIVMRFSYRRVMEELDAVLEQIATVVSRGDHRRRVGNSG